MIKYRILSVDEAEQNIVVRYFTDTITEMALANDLMPNNVPKLDANGYPTRCRTDYNLTLYDPELRSNTAALNDFIMRCAPIQWFTMKENVANSQVDTSLSNIVSKIGEVQTINVSPTIVSQVPYSISDRQFFQQLAVQGIITQEEALNANKAEIPAALLALINQLPEDTQFNAKMIISGATQFYRNNPLTIQIGTAFGFTSEQIDQFFIDASKL